MAVVGAECMMTSFVTKNDIGYSFQMRDFLCTKCIENAHYKGMCLQHIHANVADSASSSYQYTWFPRSCCWTLTWMKCGFAFQRKKKSFSGSMFYFPRHTWLIFLPYVVPHWIICVVINRASLCCVSWSLIRCLIPASTSAAHWCDVCGIL